MGGSITGISVPLGRTTVLGLDGGWPHAMVNPRKGLLDVMPASIAEIEVHSQENKSPSPSWHTHGTVIRQLFLISPTQLLVKIKTLGMCGYDLLDVICQGWARISEIFAPTGRGFHLHLKHRPESLQYSLPQYDSLA